MSGVVLHDSRRTTNASAQLRQAHTDASNRETQRRLHTDEHHPGGTAIASLPFFADYAFTIHRRQLFSAAERTKADTCRLRRNADIAEFTAQATEKEYNRDKRDLALGAKSACWNLKKALEVQRVVDENVEQVKAHLKDVQSYPKQGLTTDNEVLKVQVQLSDVQLRQIDARNNVQLDTISLNSVIGLPLDTRASSSQPIRRRHSLSR